MEQNNILEIYVIKQNSIPKNYDHLLFYNNFNKLYKVL